MKSKLTINFLLPLIGIIIFSCSKNNNPPVTSPSTEAFDTLGAGWQRIRVDSDNVSFNDIFFTDNQTGYLCGNFYLGKSTDGGLTWKNIVPDSLREQFINIFFADASNGWVTGDRFLLRTRNGGKSWEKIYTGETFDVQFLDADRGYITMVTNGVTGLSKTSDGGLTLQPIKNTPAARALFFIDENKGWYLSDALYKTDNSGVSFSTISRFANVRPYIIQFTDDMHGWIAGAGTLFKTVNGGALFLPFITNNGAEGGDVHFFDNNNGFLMLGFKIYSTIDGGTTLTQLCTIHKSTLYEIHFSDSTHGWAAGSHGYVYRYVKP